MHLFDLIGGERREGERRRDEEERRGGERRRREEEERRGEMRRREEERREMGRSRLVVGAMLQ